MPTCLLVARDCSWPGRLGVRLTKAATGGFTQWISIGYLKTATVFPVMKRVAVLSFGLRIWKWLSDCNRILIMSVGLLTSEYPGDDRIISTGWHLSISFPESPFYFLLFVSVVWIISQEPAVLKVEMLGMSTANHRLASRPRSTGHRACWNKGNLEAPASIMGTASYSDWQQPII